MRSVRLTEAYQFYKMCPKPKPIYIKQIDYDKKWKQKEKITNGWRSNNVAHYK